MKLKIEYAMYATAGGGAGSQNKTTEITTNDSQVRRQDMIDAIQIVPPDAVISGIEFDPDATPDE